MSRTGSDDPSDRPTGVRRTSRRRVVACLAALGVVGPGCLEGTGGRETSTRTGSDSPTTTAEEATPNTPDHGTSSPENGRTPVETSRDGTGNDSPELSVLVFSATAGYRHRNIEYGLQQLESRLADGTSTGSVRMETIPTDPSQFPSTVDSLRAYDAVVWFNTTGDVLDADQQAAFEQYVTGGGGYVGIHAAADTEYDWSFYGTLLGGAYFANHPAVQEATIDVTDRDHPSTEHLPARWTVTDEWYDFRTNPRDEVRVLATLDERTYDGATMSGDDHPIVWCREVEDGRAWYTGRGHTEGAFDEPAFLEHVIGGIRWSAGVV